MGKKAELKQLQLWCERLQDDHDQQQRVIDSLLRLVAEAGQSASETLIELGEERSVRSTEA